jgi:predicted N-acetyltransferase YhbS
MAEIRRLQMHERERLLDLLDGWPFEDGWRGRDFFGRYLEGDRFSERDVWVADEGGELVSCAQIFPRPVRARGASLAMGGIGSVFTRPDRRRAGLAGRVLAAVIEDMTARGMEISMLIASRVAWYQKLGWEPWSQRLLSLRRGRSGSGTHRPLDIAGFSPTRDLEAVASIHREYSGGLDGTVIRNPELWQASLACAGNPDETFLVARRDGTPVAYLRATLLDGIATLSEWGRTGREVEALVGLIDRVFAAGVPGRAEIDALSLPGLPDLPLRQALEDRGDSLEEQPAPLATMLRCLAPQALARRFGAAGEASSVLRGVLPPERHFFWPADRF